MNNAPLDWRRAPRASFSLGAESGVYALFLRDGAILPGVKAGPNGLLYIGLAANRQGFKGRCHFHARTRNHSPRKSFAVLLMKELSLNPVLIAKPNSADTWGLDEASDARLSAWMHANVELAIEVCADPDARETELVGRHAPPLNLTKCAQTEQHRRISRARAAVMAGLQAARGAMASDQHDIRGRFDGQFSTSAEEMVASIQQHPPRSLIGNDIDTAEAIAARYGLNPKSYRQRLRVSIPWYCKPQDWTFTVGSSEWRDMIAVAESMAR